MMSVCQRKYEKAMWRGNIMVKNLGEKIAPNLVHAVLKKRELPFREMKPWSRIHVSMIKEIASDISAGGLFLRGSIARSVWVAA